jgi:dinuclear metal center YbgI/SA1388 family protein
MANLGDVATAIENWYPKELAEEWDLIGVAVGDSDQVVNSALLVVDLTLETLTEAKALNCNLVVAHHPIYLPNSPEEILPERIQNVITDCKESQISVYVAHTNADNAAEGVSDALASALGLEINSSITNKELKTGMGRVGRLVTPTSLSKFAELVGKALPINNFGTLVAGDLKKEVSNVACCAGSGASLLAELANHQVDVFVTADLKHHAAIDHLQDSEIALVNVSHWASEWLWLNVLQRKLNREFPAMKVHVSNLVTDAWDLHISTGATQ